MGLSDGHSRPGSSVPAPKTASLKELLDLDPESLGLFGRFIDELEESEKRRRNLPEWLAVGPGFETEDELRSFLKIEVETIRNTNEDRSPGPPT
jgi:hypothetical protein